MATRDKHQPNVARVPVPAALNPGLLRHQGPMLKVLARILLRAALPVRAPVVPVLVISRSIPAPPARLVERYADWCGAPERYRDQLPPHMVAQWGLPLVGELLLQLPHPLGRAINQGVSLQVAGPLPRGQALCVRAQVLSSVARAGRVKLVVAITTGTAQQPALVEARLHLTFIVSGQGESKWAPATTQEVSWQAMGQWRADARDGLRFALLTGDFNPIHWCGPLARRTVFGTPVLHGFGSLARSYELLEPGTFKEIEVRFLRPVPLPSPALRIDLAPPGAEGWRALRLTRCDGTIHLAGRCR